MRRITNVTRRDIKETLINGFDDDILFSTVHYNFYFWGRLSTVDFMNRLYPLKDLPSKDKRYKNAEGDIWAHTISNPDDWPDDWLFSDDRFPLSNGRDEDLLDFICAIFHPEVRDEKSNWRVFYDRINDLLRADNYELYPKGQISGRDVFGWRDLMVRRFHKLNDNEVSMLLQLYNRQGYVLNFLTPDFDRFTNHVVGISLCKRYGLSKGKSLEKFVYDGTEEEVIKLFNALMEYYEAQPEYFDEINGNNSAHLLYLKCKDILKRVSNDNVILIEHAEELKKKFSSEFLNQEIDLMYKMQKVNPTEAIGKAKELIESCCKTILEQNEVEMDKKWDVGNLVDETVKLLEITPKNIPENIPEAKAMRAILGNLIAIASNMATLRNAYGSGHGKSASYKGLQERHAKLAIGSSVTLVNFLWDSFERKNQKANKQVFIDNEV